METTSGRRRHAWQIFCHQTLGISALKTSSGNRSEIIRKSHFIGHVLGLEQSFDKCSGPRFTFCLVIYSFGQDLRDKEVLVSRSNLEVGWVTGRLLVGKFSHTWGFLAKEQAGRLRSWKLGQPLPMPPSQRARRADVRPHPPPGRSVL